MDEIYNKLVDIHIELKKIYSSMPGGFIYVLLWIIIIQNCHQLGAK